MSASENIIDWCIATRQTSPLFEPEADALLTRLQALHAQQQALNDAHRARASLALYGHNPRAKADLLSALCGTGNGRVSVRAGNTSLDYFTHINPGHALTRMALRFTPRDEARDDAFPLRLRLLSEAGLVQVFLVHARTFADVKPVDKQLMAARLNAWQPLRQPHAVPGILPHDVAAIARFWYDITPRNEQSVDDDLWQQFIQLIPSLDLSARASVWSLLWGEHPGLTRQWLSLAQWLHQTGNACEIAAPLSLLVDSFALPADGFLTVESEPEGEVAVHPVIGDALAPVVSLPLDALALLTVEVILPCEKGVLDNVDILDIPTPDVSGETPLWASKCQWLLTYYRQTFQPDLLVICNAVRQRAAIPATAKRLSGWLDETHPNQDATLPGLVWVITAQDHRFTQKQHPDDALQQLVGKPGQRWGAWQALDNRSLQRLVEWLAQAMTAQRRTQRLQQLADRQQQRLSQLMSPWLATAPLTEQDLQTLVRELQRHAAHFGEWLQDLLPPLTDLQVLFNRPQNREEHVGELFSDTVDLFASAATALRRAENTTPRGSQIHALWMKHLRRWSRQPFSALPFAFEPGMRQRLCDILITLSYRLELPQQLQHIMQQDTVSAAQVRATLGDFLTWLGYAALSPEQRPQSRVVAGSPIFSPAPDNTRRLTQLDERPCHAATRYVYDWLVALYTRASEAPEYRPPHAITEEDRTRLRALLSPGAGGFASSCAAGAT